VSGSEGNAGSAVYNATKAAIINLTRSAALELAGRIRVNSVSPGPIETDMWPDDAPFKPLMNTLVPMGRLGQAEEVAHAIQFLASDAASFVTGQDLLVDGGYMAGMAPATAQKLFSTL
jgi:3-oxoacyl-[acyl-carrier protein] reductase